MRKHIRIQQQLKLHIESMEDEMELMEDSNQEIMNQCSDLEAKVEQLLLSQKQD